MEASLPEVRGKAVHPAWFPTPMQAVIFRNWETTDKARIAAVLETTVENVCREARRMGLSAQGNCDVWKERGYISIIRDNWHLLPYDQLLELLGWSEEHLAYALKEEDFLSGKLGGFKPACGRVTYRELTDDEKEKTARLFCGIGELYGMPKKEAFDFSYDDVPHKKASGESVWKLVDHTGDPLGAVARFTEDMKKTYGVRFSEDGGASLTLSYIAKKPEEYHEIAWETDAVTLRAGGAAGILAGLRFIKDRFGLTETPKAVYRREPQFDRRFIYLFSGLYGNAFDVDSRCYCPDELLEQYAEAGINGIWFQEVLYRLREFPFAPEYSAGWRERIAHLNDFVKRAGRYGIKVYLYLNEPRCMPRSFFDSHPELMGTEKGQNAALCMSVPAVRDYLYGAVRGLCESVPGLGGFFTITMSENLTHCNSINHVDTPCKRCSGIETWKLVALVNQIISDAAKSVDPDIEVIAWDWSWLPKYGFEAENVEACISAMPRAVSLMSKRETCLPFTRGGISGVVEDYAMSVDGIGEDSRKLWKTAKRLEHKTAAKVQINNTWECSTVPYLPIFRTLFEQIRALSEENVDHLMLSWTLGGYPSLNIRLISELFFDKTADFETAMRRLFGDEAENAIRATDKFCEAFWEFPFDLNTVYFGPQNGGPGNPLYREPTGYRATITCFAYDDLAAWRSIYPEDVYEAQFEKLCKTWKEGLCLLTESDRLYDVAFAAYALFYSSYNQIRFYRLRDGKEEDRLKRMADIAAEEEALAKAMYAVMCRHPEIGFEAANHYYFTRQAMLEKAVNCRYIRSDLRE